MKDSTNEARISFLERTAFLALVLAVCLASGARAQQICYPPHQLTDGWKAVYVAGDGPRDGWYYLEPGAELLVRFQYVYHVYGYWEVVETDAPAPSPSLTSVGEIYIARSVPQPSAPSPAGAAGASLTAAAPAGGPGARKFAVIDPVSLRSLAGFVPQGTLTRLAADQREINATMLRWAGERRLSPRSFEALRVSARRMERTLTGVVGRDIPGSGGDQESREEAVRTVTRLVENLEFVLPLLVEARLGARA